MTSVTMHVDRRRTHSSAIFWLSVLLLAVGGLCGRTARAAEFTQAEIENKRCLGCHGQTHIAEDSPDVRLTLVIPATQPATPTTDPAAGMPKARPGLFVSTEQFGASQHGRQSCISCHDDAKSPGYHPQHLHKVTCATAACHTAKGEEYRTSSHALARDKGNANAPTCASCHGGHNILPKTNPDSRIFPLKIITVCGECHEKYVKTTPAGLDGRKEVANYLDSVHGRAVANGLAVAATCSACHDAHKVLPASDPRSTVNRQHITATCGKSCHVGIARMYVGSVHSDQLTQGNPKAPVCSDCHTAHAISRTDDPGFVRDIVAECGQCHNQPKLGSREKASLYDTYRASYHGQVTQLGGARAARCSDCHGAHDIKRIDDPASRLFGEHKVETCRRCHPGADAKFAQFAPHADFRNSNRYPILHYVYLYFVIMMTGSFGFFGMHCILWFGRSVIERIKHGPHPKPDYSKGHAIQRFNKVDRINHAFVIITFFGLALTGMPLLYSDKGWAQSLASLLGGAHACGIEHRIFAVMLIGNFLVHGVGIFWRILKPGLVARDGNQALQIFCRRLALRCVLPLAVPIVLNFVWPSFLFPVFKVIVVLIFALAATLAILVQVLMGFPLFMKGLMRLIFGPTTMLPTRKDLFDCLGMFKWFFIGGKKPRFERWTYWEKFDYMAEVGGSGIIGLSGLLLWFPVFFSAFVPGWAFNVATIVHGFEALLAVGFIFTIHFFNAHLRLEKFPVDDVMFTGRMPEEEFKHERGAEYDRLVAAGQLDSVKAKVPPPSYRYFAVAMGILAQLVGTALIVLIILAALRII